MSLTRIIADSISNWRARAAVEADLDHIPDADLAGFGLSRAELADVAMMPAERIARMEAMARLHGVEQDRLDQAPSLRAEVALNCARCGSNRACRTAMADPNLRASETGFCPNIPTWAALAAE